MYTLQSFPIVPILLNVPAAAGAAEVLLSFLGVLLTVLLLAVNTVSDIKSLCIAPKSTYILTLALLLQRAGLAFIRKAGMSSFLLSLTASLMPGILLKLLSVIAPQMIGGGDGTVIMALGCALNFDTLLLSLFFAFAGAGLWGITLLIRHKGVRAEFPFMPFLSTGTLSAVMIGLRMRHCL